MNNAIISIIIIVATLLGAGLIYVGFMLGFKFSCAIRQVSNGEEPTIKSFNKEPAEHELLEEDENV